MEDLISRQAVIDACDQSINLFEAVDRIKELAPVTPKPKTGHWIGHREHCEMNNLIPSGLGSYFWCSECDCGIDAKEWHRNNYNYCPNCGAKMIEPQESEDI